ncbi:MAG: helix-turn-helix domain-containing protein [Candidatus Dormibacteria bacterium]
MSVVLAADRLRFELARRGWGNADLARAARVSAPTVTAALSGRPVAPRTLMRIAVALADCQGT